MIDQSPPIPSFRHLPGTDDYHQITIDQHHPLHDDPLVNVADYGLSQNSYYGRRDGQNPPYHHAIAGSQEQVVCRKTVAEKLREVDLKLQKQGIRLHLLDGYRPLACQKALWDFTLSRIGRHIDDPDQCRKMVSRYWSDPDHFDPDDYRTWPTHITGGAVDLTLHTLAGEPLYMGGVFDDPCPISHSAHYEQPTDSDSFTLRQAKINRRRLFWSMTDAGFANYGHEWWHFDWGTQMWVMNRKKLFPDENITAFYGLPCL